MKKFLRGLNAEQASAASTIDGPLLVLAGAGTGKTRVITVRMAHMLSIGIDPRSVLAMTFTNKAAAEMRARVAKLVGSKPAELLTVGTFHSFCLKLLREHTAEIGFPKGFTICDAADQLSALKGALRELRIPEAAIQPSTLQARISLLKNRLVSPEEFMQRPGDETDELIGRAFRRYQDHLRRSRNLDFDDLLLEALRLLRENAAVREKIQERYRFLLVDEYQDTNGPQYELVRIIGLPERNVCVVGDDDQSIYSWRGADVSKILGFERDYPGAKIVRLETNYRSSQEILDAANKIIRNNPSRHDKTLRSHLGRGELIQAVMSRDETVEAEYVVRDILERTKRKEAALGDFAILFRTAVQPRTFEAELRARNLPYVLVGGQSFFDRKEVRDVMAFLKLMANPRDEVSLLRVINCPPRGVGKSTIDKALEFATEKGIAVGEAFDRAEEIEGINAKAVEAVQRLRARLNALALGST
ncbi:MAG: UvrD-helicase domain-containing protein, partial [Planctomycetes bacterium]|nr:UvrD-helicase domain-containing protein [Planctomycetota bacterium]